MMKYIILNTYANSFIWHLKINPSLYCISFERFCRFLHTYIHTYEARPGSKDTSRVGR